MKKISFLKVVLLSTALSLGFVSETPSAFAVLGDEESNFSVADWSRHFMRGYRDENQARPLLDELERQARGGHEGACKTLCGIAQKGFLQRQDLKNPVLLEEMLGLGVRRGAYWVLPICQDLLKEKGISPSLQRWARLGIFNVGEFFIIEDFWYKELGINPTSLSLFLEKELNKAPLKAKKNSPHVLSRDQVVQNFVEKWKNEPCPLPFIVLANMLNRLNMDAEPIFQLCVERGHVESMIELVQYYKKKDKMDKAAALVEKAARLGNPIHMHVCARFFEASGRLPKAIKWYEQLVKQDDTAAKDSLATLIRDKDPQRAERLWREAVAGGSVVAQNNLGTFLIHRNLIEAEKFLLFSIENKNYSSYVNLGHLEQFIKKNKKKAMEYYEKSLENEYYEVYNNMGLLVLEDNPGLAKEYYKKAQKTGKPEAFLNLGILLHHTSPREAMVSYEKGIARGEKRCMNNLGCLLIKTGVAADRARAMELFREAGVGGLVDGSYNLAIELLDESPEEAEFLLLQAAYEEHSDAMVALGGIYAKRYESSKNLMYAELARFYMTRAAALQNPKALEIFAYHKKENEKRKIKESFLDVTDSVLEESRAMPEISHLSSDEDEVDLLGDTFEASFSYKPVASGETETKNPKEAPQSAPSPAPLNVEEAGGAVNGGDLSALEEARKEDLNAFDEAVVFVYPKKNDLKKKGFWRRHRQALEAPVQEKREELRPLLEAASQKIIHCMRQNPGKIARGHLDRLFKDPYFGSGYFGGGVKVSSTASGLKIEAVLTRKNIHKITTTHNPHNKTYKGYDQNFLDDVREILQFFEAWQ